jgi:broad specificity phosphatase PhoE
MKVYFVRHGESVANAEKRHQDENEPLSQKGREQAHVVATRVGDLHIEHVLASPYTRARETAHIIAEHVGLSVSFLESLVEISVPTFFVGKNICRAFGRARGVSKKLFYS